MVLVVNLEEEAGKQTSSAVGSVDLHQSETVSGLQPEKTQVRSQMTADITTQEKSKMTADITTQEKSKMTADITAQERSKMTADTTAQETSQKNADITTQERSKLTADATAQETSQKNADITTQDEERSRTSKELLTKNANNKRGASGMMIPTLQTLVKAIREQLAIKNQAETLQALLSNCKTNEDRISLMYNLPIVHEVLDVKESYKGKDEEVAKSLRLQGNLAFQRKDYDVAVKRYSESILKAPSDEGTELSLAFANRSAVLYHQKHYTLCLQDIRQAFKYSYPQHLRYKLFERRGKAFYFLSSKKDAVCAFQDAINELENSQLADSKFASVKEDLTKQLQKCEKLRTVLKVKNVKEFNHSHGPLPSTVDPLNTQIPCMGNALAFKYSEKNGRGLYATRDIEVGEILIVEKPYASITLLDYNLTHCHHCCNRVACPLPCYQCSGVVFCSEECQEVAWQSYHYVECRYHDLIQKSELGLGHLALRMVLKAGQRYLHELKNVLQEKSSTQLTCNKEGVYDSNDYQTVYNLVGHTEDRSPIDLFRRTVCAVFLLKCIEKSSFFTNSDGIYDMHKEKMYIGGHILRNIQMLPCNAHEVSEFLYKSFNVQMSEPEEIGSAIYATLSLINHSCDPSVVRHSYGNECVVRAIRNIAKGEEVFDNYGVLYPVMSKPMRQEKLLSQYLFTCSCHACTRNWPMYEKIRSECPVLKCKKCKIGRVMIPADNQTTRAICADCREVIDITPDLLHLSKSENFYQGSLDKVLKGEERTEGLPFLTDHLRLIDRLLIRPWKDYNDCQEAIKQCYSSMANCITVEEPDSDEEELMQCGN